MLSDGVIVIGAPHSMSELGQVGVGTTPNDHLRDATTLQLAELLRAKLNESLREEEARPVPPNPYRRNGVGDLRHKVPKVPSYEVGEYRPPFEWTNTKETKVEKLRFAQRLKVRDAPKPVPHVLNSSWALDYNHQASRGTDLGSGHHHMGGRTVPLPPSLAGMATTSKKQRDRISQGGSRQSLRDEAPLVFQPKHSTVEVTAIQECSR